MPEIFSFDELEAFERLAGVEDRVRTLLRGAGSYVIRCGNGGLLLAFSLKDGSAVRLFADESRCALMSDCDGLNAKVSRIRGENGLQELFSFFVLLTLNDAAELQELEDAVEQLEDDLADPERRQGGLARIRARRREILDKKRYYEQMELLSDDLGVFNKDFVFIDRKFDRLLGFLLRTQEFLEQVREGYEAQIDIEQNDIMKVLTIAATIFMPLTLITGWYGMNLMIPECTWRFAYPCVIALSVAVVVAEVVYFKNKKWM